jgi:hypothetical protein
MSERYRVTKASVAWEEEGEPKWCVIDNESGMAHAMLWTEKDANETAAALNAAAQRDERDKLLREARSIIADCSMQRLRREGWLMRFAALEKEGKDG